MSDFIGTALTDINGGGTGEVFLGWFHIIRIPNERIINFIAKLMIRGKLLTTWVARDYWVGNHFLLRITYPIKMERWN